jgi:hypothetical protein
LAAALFFAACGDGDTGAPERMTGGPRRPAAEVVAEETNRLLAIDGVQGLYVGLTEEGDTCIAVMVTRDAEEMKKKLPAVIGGYPVRIEDGGEIRPMR